MIIAEGNGDDEGDIEFEGEDAFGDGIKDNTEKCELDSDSVLEVLSVGDAVALLSSSKSLEEHFYHCKVVHFGVVTKNLQNKNIHCIGNDDLYIVMQYLRVKKETT